MARPVGKDELYVNVGACTSTVNTLWLIDSFKVSPYSFKKGEYHQSYGELTHNIFTVRLAETWSVLLSHRLAVTDWDASASSFEILAALAKIIYGNWSQKQK